MSEISSISDEHPWTGLLPSVKTSSFRTSLGVQNPDSGWWNLCSMKWPKYYNEHLAFFKADATKFRSAGLACVLWSHSGSSGPSSGSAPVFPDNKRSAANLLEIKYSLGSQQLL